MKFALLLLQLAFLCDVTMSLLRVHIRICCDQLFLPLKATNFAQSLQIQGFRKVGVSIPKAPSGCATASDYTGVMRRTFAMLCDTA